MAEALLGAVELELQNERASALGESGRRIEAAMTELALGDTEDRLTEAATAVWYFMILRESLHFYDHKEALAHYAVPPRVVARVGVVKPIT